MNKIIIFLTSLLIISQSFGQTGNIRGKVIDNNTGEELIGATIVINGTTTGTITDFDGNYTLSGITNGTYPIRCSFISYETILVQDVEVIDNDVIIINFNLKNATVDIGEVKIQAKAIKRTENALLVIQKKSATMIDGISSQQISRLGDSDAAGALKRVTGISVEGGKYVYVRGLSDRYSKTTLNGAEIPGLDPDRNTVQMDLFPSNIIENMIVHKTFSPDLPGSFVGGLVNISTKDFPEKFTFQYSSSFGYNPNSNLNSNFLSYKGGKFDWIASEDGTRDLPEIANTQIPSRYQNDDLLDNITKSFNKQYQPDSIKSFVNQSHSISIGNQIPFGKKILGFIASLSYSNNYKYYDDGFTGRYKLKEQGSLTLNKELVLTNDIKGVNEIIWAGMISTNLKISNNNKLGLILIRNQSGESLTRYQKGKKYSDANDMFYETRTLQYLQRSFSSAQLNGEHYLQNFNKIKINWLSSFTQSAQDEPDLRFFTNHYIISGEEKIYEIAQSLYPAPTRFYRDLKENNIDNKINLTIPFQFQGDKAKFKIGSSLVLKNRDFNEKKIQFVENSNTYNGNIYDYLNDDNISASGGFLHAVNSERSDLKNSYQGKQYISAAYAMVDVPYYEKLRIIAGLRMEYTFIEAKNKSKETDILNYSNANLRNFDLLPSLNLTYKLIKDMNLRLAYTRTLARPSFRELVPYASLNFVGDFVFVGNPDLERSLIDNADIKWEYFPNRGEIISISGFYKLFNNPIERTFNTEAANPELTLRNVNEAKLAGIEVEFRKNLNFINFLKDFKIGSNFTFVKSAVSVDAQELSEKRYFDSDFPKTRVMYGQAPFIINAYLNYHNDSLNIDANIGFNIEGEKLSIINATGIPDIYEQPKAKLDFSLSKDIGNNIKLKFSAKNILDSKNQQTYSYNGKTYTYQRYTIGRYFSLSFTYLIN